MNNYEKAAEEMIAAGRAASESDRSSARILALAAEHDLITAAEPPEVLARIEEARSGPAGGEPAPDLAQVAKAWRATPFVDAHGSTATWVRALTALERAIDGLPSGAGPAANPPGKLDGSPPAAPDAILPLTEIDAAERRRLAGERADAIARLESEVEQLRAAAKCIDAVDTRLTAIDERVDRVHAEAQRFASEAGDWQRKCDALAEAIEAHLPEVPRLTEDSAPAGLVERLAYAGEMLSMAERQRDEFGAELDRIGVAIEAHLPPLEGNEFDVARMGRVRR
jgi:hypothetical protein